MPTNPPAQTNRLSLVSACSAAEAAAERAATIARFTRRTANVRSARTAEIYAWAADRLHLWLAQRGDVRGFAELHPEDDLEQFLADFEQGRAGFAAHAPSYVNQVYRSLGVFYSWLAERYEVPNPMPRVAAPRLGERLVADEVLSLAQLRALLASVERGRDFTCVRDHAMLRLLLTGVRRGELVGIRGEGDLNMAERLVRVRGKGDRQGSRERDVAFSVATRDAVDDYLELRQRHAFAAEAGLWVGKRGPLTGRGVLAIVAKRGEAVGISGLHPHMFRHTVASRWMEDGGSESHLMEHMGWQTGAMVRRYGKDTLAKRAQEEARRHALDGL